MEIEKIVREIKKKNSFLCVGLDSDISKIPSHFKQSSLPLFEFNKFIIESTHEYCIAYKINTAFYESRGVTGWKELESTISYLNEKYPDHFTIADAKRGDIGNTSKMYGETFFNHMKFDSITVSPYMGYDSVSPFLEYKDKWTILLALTSNTGSNDFQKQISDNQFLFEKVLETSKKWSDNIMWVVGATNSDLLRKVREIIPNGFILVPGVGFQGGSLDEVVKYGMNSNCGLIVNSSRNIIYSSDPKSEAQKIQKEMEIHLKTTFQQSL